MITNVGWAFVNVWIVAGSDGLVIVDAHYPRHEDRIVRRLERADLDPDAVTAIVLTHGHGDHAGSAGALAAELDVPVIVGAGDAQMLRAGDHGDSADPTGSRGRLFGFAERPKFPAFEPGRVVSATLDLDEYGVDAELRVVGGHTPGSLVITTPDGVLVGDLVRSGIISHHRPTLHFFHSDATAAHAALAAVVADPSVTVLYPGHGSTLDADRVRDWLDRRQAPLDARWARQAARRAR